MSNIEFNIREFDMSQVGKNRTILFIGTKNSGKTTLIHDYLNHNQNIPTGLCVSPIDEYSQKFPSIFHEQGSTQYLLQNFINGQHNAVRYKRSNNDIDNDNDIDIGTVLIFDDYPLQQDDPNIQTIFMNGRHLYITFLIASQRVSLPPNFRTNLDYIFICKETDLIARKKLYRHYAYMFPNYETFSQVLDQCTQNFGCLVIDNASNKKKLEDKVFWYRCNL